MVGGSFKDTSGSNVYAGGGTTTFENVKTIKIDNVTVSDSNYYVALSSHFTIYGYKDGAQTTIVDYTGNQNVSNIEYDTSMYDKIAIWCYSYHGTVVQGTNVTLVFK